MTTDSRISPGGRPADADRLLAEAEWLRGLAIELVGRQGPDAVDDLVQDTMLLRLRSAAPAAGRERAWLRRVAGNLVNEAFRRRGRRRRRELAAAASETVGSTSDVVARAQTHRLLVSAVLDLREPFRSTLLRRYFDRAEPAAIAVEDGVSATTVRTRIHRGLAQLRERLTAQHGGRREDWIAGVVAVARTGPAPIAASAGVHGAFGLGGALLMQKLLLGALVVVFVGTAVWFVGNDEPSVRGEVVSQLDTAPDQDTAAANSPELRVRTAAVKPPMADVATPPAARPATDGSATVRVTGAGRHRAGTAVAFQRERYPAEVASLYLRQHGDRIASLLDGRATFDGLTEGQWFFAVLEGDEVLAQRSVRVRAGADAEAVFPLGSASIEGVVRNADGQPQAQQLVRCSLLDQGAYRSDTLTDARGRYRFAAVPMGSAWIGVYATADFSQAPRFMREFEIAEAKTYRADFGQHGGSSIWRGAIRNRLGQRVLGQEVDFRPGRLLLRNTDGERRIVPLRPDGTFEASLPAGRWNVRVQAPSQVQPTELPEPVLIEDGDLAMDLDLPWRRVAGRLRDRATGNALLGLLVADARVELWRVPSEARSGASARLLGVHRIDPTTGAYLFDAVDPGADYELRCAAIGATQAFELPESADHLEVDLVGRSPK